MCSGCKAALFCSPECESASSLWHENWCALVSRYVESARRAAEAGDPRAQRRVGLLFKYGLGVQADKVAAELWCRRAADRGDADALYELGRCHEQGLGIACDVVAAVAFYNRAVAAGSVCAMVALGFCFEHGRGVAVDSTRAAGLFLRARAAAAGSAGAQASLARCFDLVGVAEDLEVPAELHSSASPSVGHAAARSSLAGCSRDGDKTAAVDAAVSFEELPRNACVKAAAPLRLVCEGYRWVADTGVWESDTVEQDRHAYPIPRLQSFRRPHTPPRAFPCRR